MKETPQEYTRRIARYTEGKNPLQVQAATAKKLERLIKGVPAAKLRKRPAPDRWSVNEILAHLSETEIVGGFRMRLILGAPGTPIVPTGRKLDCFCLDLFGIGAAKIEYLLGYPTLVVDVDAVDVPEIAPKGLKEAVNCYALDTVRLVLRERLNFPLVKTFFFNLAFLSLPTITVAPAPNPPIPNNPAIENNQLKVFIDFTVGP